MARRHEEKRRRHGVSSGNSIISERKISYQRRGGIIKQWQRRSWQQHGKQRNQHRKQRNGVAAYQSAETAYNGMWRGISMAWRHRHPGGMVRTATCVAGISGVAGINGGISKASGENGKNSVCGGIRTVVNESIVQCGDNLRSGQRRKQAARASSAAGSIKRIIFCLSANDINA